ncbi:MAG: lytic transglycosylase domain-containing protein [Candidatus Aminicenantes bacterium]|nr:lytic transglycosylase domain-containing protein [Candidatus Aminicenantes bacterium]
MFKRNLKKSFYLIIFLFLVGLTGLFIALVELNTRYEEKHSKITNLTVELNRLENQMSLARAKLDEYDFLAFKADVFQRRDPQLFKITESVYKKSSQYGFEPELIWGVMKVESGYNPRAVSHRGACGLMQVNFSVWKDELSIDKKRIFDIDYNIDLGLQILKRYYLESKGDIKKALHLYNNGYRYKNFSYVNKVKSQLWNLSLSNPGATGLSEVGTKDGYGLRLIERKEK